MTAVFLMKTSCGLGGGACGTLGRGCEADTGHMHSFTVHPLLSLPPSVAPAGLLESGNSFFAELSL